VIYNNKLDTFDFSQGNTRLYHRSHVCLFYLLLFSLPPPDVYAKKSRITVVVYGSVLYQ